MRDDNAVEWAALSRRHTKAMAALTGARAFLERVNTYDTPDEDTTWDALVLLDHARKRLDVERDAHRTRLYIGVYKPYGRDFPRRW